MIKISRIYMDYETSPVGVSHMPQFGWEIESDKRNVKQKYYKLQICLDEAKMVKESDGLEFVPAKNCMKAEAGSEKYRIVFERAWKKAVAQVLAK